MEKTPFKNNFFPLANSPEEGKSKKFQAPISRRIRVNKVPMIGQKPMLAFSELRNDGLTCREKQNLKSKSRWTKHKYFDTFQINSACSYGDVYVKVS